MASYPKVTQAKITSLDLASFDGGLDQRGQANIKANSLSVLRNGMIDRQGLATQRLVMRRWLPDIVGTAYQVAPTLYNGTLVYLVADNGHIKYCHDGDSSWTTCPGDTVTTTGVTTTFLRVLNKVLILNGVDYLGYVDLTNLTVYHFSAVADPTTAPTSAYQGTSASGSFKLYYAIWYSGLVGTTKSTPILTVPINKIREQWSSAGTDGVIITDPNTRPTGARSWNIGLATAPAGGTIQLSDIVPLALGLDLATTTFTDNGSIDQIQNAGTAPTTNTTAGPKANYGVQIGGRPFLYGITNDPYAVLIGGDDTNALDFTAGNGGYRLILNDGTDFFPTAIIPFRNGQGVPSITALYSSTSGLSKTSVIEQNTVSLGTFSATVWGSTDQDYGSAGVSSPYAVVDYRGSLVYPSVDGIIRIDTSSQRFNVLTATRISDRVSNYIESIKSELYPQIVGTAFGNRMMFTAPTQGFNTNNAIIVYDITNTGDECFYVFDIAAQWIGTVSPPGDTGFIYVCQGNHFFRLEEGFVAQDDVAGGTTAPFPVEYTTALVGTNAGHNGYMAVVQAVFYLKDFVGNATLTFSWRDYQSGEMKSKTKTVSNGTYSKSSAGNWSGVGYLYNQHQSTTVKKFSNVDKITTTNSTQKISKSYALRVNNVITNEMQGDVSIGLDNSTASLRSVGFEGQVLGISPDVK